MRKSLQLLLSNVHKEVQFTAILQQRRAENHEVEKLEAQNPGRSSLSVEQNLPRLKPVWREECVLHLPLKVTHSVITRPLCDRWSSIHCSTDNNTSITCSHHPDHQLALAVSYKTHFCSGFFLHVVMKEKKKTVGLVSSTAPPPQIVQVHFREERRVCVAPRSQL